MFGNPRASAESPFSGNPKEVAPSPELIREVYEYRDAKGNLICTAEAEFEPIGRRDFMDSPYLAYGRYLKSFVLRGANGAEADVLKLAKTKHRRIVVRQTRREGESFYFDDEKDVVVSPPLESPLDVATLLHELGHADQYTEEIYRQITEFHKVQIWSVSDPKEVDGYISELRGLGVEVDSLLINEFKELLEKSKEPGGAISGPESKQVKSRLEKIRSELDWLHYATQHIMERDATYRAIRWMRQLRDRGIDLIAPMLVDPQEIARLKKVAAEQRHADCVTDMLSAIGDKIPGQPTTIDPIEKLRLSLASYGADTKQMLKLYKGKIPRAQKK